MEENRFVECSEHGKQQATFICHHIVQSLRDGKPRGFWQGDDPGNPRPDAWCTECEKRVQSENGEWNDKNESFAKVTLICGSCYDRVKKLNQEIS